MEILTVACPGRTTLAAILAITVMLASPAATADETKTLELAVKASYLAKFGLFVQWPAGALGPANAPLEICVVGQDPFGKALDEAIRGRSIQGRPLEVKRLTSATPQSDCHILFAAGSPAQSAGEIVAAVEGTGVLTVTDAAGPGAPAGVINFVIDRNRVKFEIDRGAADANGLEVSSRLLGLALNVR